MIRNLFRNAASMFVIAIALAYLFPVYSPEICAKRIRLSLKAPKQEVKEARTEVKLANPKSNPLRLDSLRHQIVFSGFDKKGSSMKESFFVTNNSDCKIVLLKIQLTYSTPEGNMLDVKTRDITPNLPPGESRKVDIPSFDIQKSFHYIKSNPSRNGSSPFSVAIEILEVATF